MTQKQNKITFNSSSNMFSVRQPDSYNFGAAIEERCESVENTDYEQRCNELVSNTRRCDLPKKHPQYLPAGRYSVEREKFLRKILAPAWFAVWKYLLKHRDCRIKIKTRMTGIDSPYAYNYVTDAVCFTLSISEQHLESVREHVFAHAQIFDEYLRLKHENYNACWGCSFMPRDATDWLKSYQSHNGAAYTLESTVNEDYERAVCSLLDFWLFAFEDGIPSMETFFTNTRLFSPNLVEEMETILTVLPVRKYMRFEPAVCGNLCPSITP